MKIRKLKTATALGSLTASVALLAGASGAHAQGAPGAGSFPNSFLIPGTQTSIRIGGFVDLLYAYDFSVCSGALAGSGPGGGAAGLFDANGTNHVTGHLETAVAGHQIHGCSDFTAGISRLQFETRTPTAYGELKTFIAGDFQGPSGLTPSSSFQINSNGLGFRIREAYGTLGPFLAGQTISNFRDASVEAEVIDNGGPNATGPLRLPQVRYTFDFGNGLTLAVAAEQPGLRVFSADGSSPGGTQKTTFGTGLGNKIPDFTGKLNYAAPWGHVNFRFVARDLYWHDGGGALNPLGPEPHSTSSFGWGLGVAGTWNVGWGKDALSGAFNYGDGADRYVGGSGSPQADAVLDFDSSNTDLKKVTSWQVQANYAHWWTDSLRTNLLGSYYKRNNKLGEFADAPPPGNQNSSALSNMVKDAWFTGVNLIWSPVPQVDLGVEFAYSETQLESHQRVQQSRLNAEAIFRF